MCYSLEIYNQYAASWVADGWLQQASASSAWTLGGSNNEYIQFNGTGLTEANSRAVYNTQYQILEGCTHTFSFGVQVGKSEGGASIKIYGVLGGTPTLLYTSDPMELVMGEIAIFTFEYVGLDSYDYLSWQLSNVNDEIYKIYGWSMSRCCDVCDEEQDTSDKYLVDQAQVSAAITKAKCCYGDIKSKQLADLKAGLEICPCTNDKLVSLSASIFSLERYFKGGCNCVSDNEAYKHIENINKLCGCTDC